VGVGSGRVWGEGFVFLCLSLLTDPTDLCDLG